MSRVCMACSTPLVTTAPTSGGHALPTGTPYPGPPARTTDIGFRQPDKAPSKQALAASMQGFW